MIYDRVSSAAQSERFEMHATEGATTDEFLRELCKELDRLEARFTALETGVRVMAELLERAALLIEVLGQKVTKLNSPDSGT